MKCISTLADQNVSQPCVISSEAWVYCCLVVVLSLVVLCAHPHCISPTYVWTDNRYSATILHCGCLKLFFCGDSSSSGTLPHKCKLPHPPWAPICLLHCDTAVLCVISFFLSCNVGSASTHSWGDLVLTLSPFLQGSQHCASCGPVSQNSCFTYSSFTVVYRWRASLVPVRPSVAFIDGWGAFGCISLVNRLFNLCSLFYWLLYFKGNLIQGQKLYI